jgi:hypothetical protein
VSTNEGDHNFLSYFLASKEPLSSFLSKGFHKKLVSRVAQLIEHSPSNPKGLNPGSDGNGYNGKARFKKFEY